MSFTVINRQTWPRNAHFEHYLSLVPCQYSMTVSLDITSLVKTGRKLYPSMLYALSSVVNRHEEFRMAFNDKDELGIYDRLCPSYTIFHKDTETFSTLWTTYDDDYETFLRSCKSDMARFGNVKDFEAKPQTPVNSFPVSMIPWESFESFHLHLPRAERYFFPIFTMGKYVEREGKFLLPLAVQVHHAVCDGFHVCRLTGELRELVACL